MMDEMAKTLARRRAAVCIIHPLIFSNNFPSIDFILIQAEKKDPELESEDKKSTWEKTNTLPSNTKYSESPKSVRKRFGSASEETILKVNGLSSDSVVGNLSLGPSEFDSLKNEIVKEVRKEMSKMKQEILDGEYYMHIFHYNYNFVNNCIINFSISTFRYIPHLNEKTPNHLAD